MRFCIGDTAVMKLLVAVVVLLAGCARSYEIQIRGRDIHRQLGAIRHTGSAEVEGRRIWRDHDDPVRVSLSMRRSLLHDGKTVTLTDLAHDCGDVVPFAGDHVSQRSCSLVRMKDEDFIAERGQLRDVRGTIYGYAVLVGLTATVGSAVCWAECPDDSSLKTPSKVIAGTVGTVLAGWVLWELAQCFWGTHCGH